MAEIAEEPKFKIGEEVEVLGKTVETNYIGFVDGDMDEIAGTFQEVRAIEYWDGHPVYRVTGCGYFWAGEWLKKVDSSSEISVQDFSEVFG